jgi:hypothetical protein
MHRHVCGHNAYASSVRRAMACATGFVGACGATSIGAAASARVGMEVATWSIAQLTNLVLSSKVINELNGTVVD